MGLFYFPAFYILHSTFYILRSTFYILRIHFADTLPQIICFTFLPPFPPHYCEYTMTTAIGTRDLVIHQTSAFHHHLAPSYLAFPQMS